MSLLHKNGKGGRLYTVDGEIGELKEDFKAASRSNGEMISLRGSTAELSERLETEQRQSDTINKNLAGHRMLEIRARRKRLEDAERDYREIVAEADAFRKENTRNGFFPDREYARQLEECAGAIANAEARRKEADSLLKKLERRGMPLSPTGIPPRKSGMPKRVRSVRRKPLRSPRRESAYCSLLLRQRRRCLCSSEKVSFGSFWRRFRCSRLPEW